MPIVNDPEWVADRIEAAVSRLRKQRPPRLCDEGDLNPEVAAWSERLAQGQAGNLLIVGQKVGTGKTWSMWEGLERAARSGYLGRVLFCTAGEWRRVITPKMDDEQFALMQRVDFLVLDDLGSSRMGAWELEKLLDLTEERWSYNRPTGITSNIEDLRGLVGERIASRLSDGATAVVLDGPDRRRAR